MSSPSPQSSSDIIPPSYRIRKHFRLKTSTSTSVSHSCLPFHFITHSPTLTLSCPLHFKHENIHLHHCHRYTSWNKSIFRIIINNIIFVIECGCGVSVCSTNAIALESRFIKKFIHPFIYLSFYLYVYNIIKHKHTCFLPNVCECETSYTIII